MGQELEFLSVQPGWTKIIELMKGFEAARTADMLNYLGTDPNVLKSMQISTRAVREIRRECESYIAESVNAAKELLNDENRLSEESYV